MFIHRLDADGMRLALRWRHTCHEIAQDGRVEFQHQRVIGSCGAGPRDLAHRGDVSGNNERLAWPIFMALRAGEYLACVLAAAWRSAAVDRDLQFSRMKARMTVSPGTGVIAAPLWSA